MNNFAFQTDFSGDGLPKQMLRVNDERVREDIIRNHFFHFYQETYGVKLPDILIDRDGASGGKPYDFVFQDADGVVANIEITYLFDNADHFTELGVQDEIKKLINKRGLTAEDIVVICPPVVNRGHVLRLAFDQLPYAPSRRDGWISRALRKAKRDNKILLYRRHGPGDGSFHTHFQSKHTDLLAAFDIAVTKKLNKAHVDASEVILLLDEATYFSREDFKHQTPQLIRTAAKYPFKEIFVYSGYYSDLDGKSSEFAFYPLKCARESQIKQYLGWPMLEP